jgi:dihydrolipoamide dehydrogenase
MIGELAAAVTNRLTRAQLEKTVRPHPTFCEAVTEAAMAAAGHAVHAMPVKKRG